ncbi:MAG: hypothetical protein ACK56I_22405, partial [bacterium]
MVFIRSKLIFWLVFIAEALYGQKSTGQLPEFSFTKGIGFTAPDSNFSIAIRLRVQNRIGFLFTENEDGKWELSQ